MQQLLSVHFCVPDHSSYSVSMKDSPFSHSIEQTGKLIENGTLNRFQKEAVTICKGKILLQCKALENLFFYFDKFHYFWAQFQRNKAKNREG
jgi:hypothetical protein